MLPPVDGRGLRRGEDCKNVGAGSREYLGGGRNGSLSSSNSKNPAGSEDVLGRGGRSGVLSLSKNPGGSDDVRGGGRIGVLSSSLSMNPAGSLDCLGGGRIGVLSINLAGSLDTSLGGGRIGVLSINPAGSLDRLGGGRNGSLSFDSNEKSSTSSADP